MKKSNPGSAVRQLISDNYYRLLILAILCIIPSMTQAQQARGLFFSVFGTDASTDLGDFDNVQAIYFEIPESEQREVYLRIFDPDVSGNYEELQGKYNTETRFVLLGGNSADTVFGGSKNFGYEMPEFDNNDIIYDRTFGYDLSLDSQYLNFGRLPKSEGYATEDGYRKYVLLVKGQEGNDSNYFDLLLSLDPNSKKIPDNTHIYAYDLSLRVPDWTDFIGQISIDPQNHQNLDISTFDMDNTPIYLERPFTDNYELTPSGDGNWTTNNINLSELENPEYLNFTFEGEDFNNTFNLLIQAPSGKPLPLELPIPNYEPPKVPEFSFKHAYDSQDCKRVAFTTDIEKSQDFQPDKIQWAINSDTLLGKNVEYTFPEPGTYEYNVSIQGILRGEKISQSLRDSVYINAPPNAWSGGDRVHIPGEPIAFDGTVSEDSDGKIASYHWNFGDGTEKSGARVDHTYNKTGTYNLSLKVFDNSDSPCNSDTHTANVKINEQPQAVIDAPSYVEVGEIFSLDASKSKDPDGKIVEYNWQFDNDTTLSGEMIQYSLDRRGSWTIKLLVKDDSDVENSTDVAETTIRINKEPVAEAGIDKKVSPGLPVTLSAEDSYDPDGNIEEYQWILPDNTLNGINQEIKFNEPGKHQVILKIRDNSRTGEDRDTMYVYVNYPPVPKIDGDTLYNRGRVSLSAAESFDEDGNITDYSWSMGDGTEYSSKKVEHTYEESGTYNVQLTVKDNSGTQSTTQSISKKITVNSLPVADFESVELTSPDRKITLDASDSYDKDGYIKTFEWDFGDGNTGAGARTSYSYDKPGTYQIQLKVTDNSGHSDAVGYAYKEIRVNAQPKIIYNAPELTSAKDTITIEASDSYDPDGQIIEYRWNINGEWRQGSANMTINNPGKLIEPVILAVIDNSDAMNSRNEEVIPINFNSAPKAFAGKDKRTHKRTLVFDGTKSTDQDNDMLDYVWHFSDEETKKGSLVSHTYREGGRHKAILSVDDQNGLNNSRDTDTVEVFINNSPQAILDVPDMVCVGDTFQFTGRQSFDIDKGSDLTYKWTLNDGKEAQAASGYHVYDQPGTYEISLTVSDNEGLPNSTSQTSKSIEVAGLPKAIAGEDKTVCINEPVQFDASQSHLPGGTINEFEWNFSDGTKAKGILPKHQFSEPGTYKVELTVSDSSNTNCQHSDSDEVTVQVKPPPKARFDIPRNVFEGDSITLDPGASSSNESNITALTWYIGNLETIRWSLLNYSDSLGIDHKEWYMYSDSVMPNRVVDLESLQGKLPTSERSLQAGEYPVTLEVKTAGQTNCNTASKTKFINVRELPELSIEEIPVLTPGESHEFRVDDDKTDINSIVNGNWSFDNDTFKDGLHVNHTFENPGNYTIAFSASPAGDNSRVLNDVTKQVHVNAPPQPNIQSPDTVYAREAVEFTSKGSMDPDGSIIEYQWSLPDGDTSNNKNATYTFKDSGNHTVSLTVVDNDEVDNSTQITSRTIYVREDPEYSLDLPNKVCMGSTIDITKSLSIDLKDTSSVNIFMGQTRISYSQGQSQTFNKPGRYNLHVEINDNEVSKELEHTFIVNGPPEIQANIPKDIYIGGANDFATFDASNTVDPNKDSINLYWDMGDGTNRVGKTILHRYQKPGVYTVTVTAIDSQDMSCSQSRKQYKIKVDEL